MKIIHLTPGSGDNFYCENCLRDHAIVQALRRQGHDALIVPMYLPPQMEETGRDHNAPIFFGGINVYLQQKFGFFRKSHRWLDRWLDSPRLLGWAARRAGMTNSRSLAKTALSMLKGEQGRQVKELDKLISWLASENRPDVVCLSNALLMGVARRIRREIKTPVVCLLQDEDEFLDDLPQPQQSQCWDELIRRAAEIDQFVAASNYFARQMLQRLQLDQDRVKVVYNGLLLEGFQPADTPPPTPTIGFLSRMYPKKGLDLLADAFIILKQIDRLRHARLRISGGKTVSDEAFVEEVKRRLAAAGVIKDVEFLPGFERRRRQEFLRTLSVLSVPARRGEACGRYALEAMACGVPIVQPAKGVFPELAELTKGAILLPEPIDAGNLAAALVPLLLDGDKARQLGQKARKAIIERFNIENTAKQMTQVFEQVKQNFHMGSHG
ncbi:MAG: hypothetical protein AMJ79_03500 [Phycisphaerae bacterium SM23_30]|nr:MAG: hypothetical protein AMJ79_03500 [Phycisphaerae bacterium SM23_30]